MTTTHAIRNRFAAVVAAIGLALSPALLMAAPAHAVVATCADSGCPDPTNWAAARFAAHAGYPSFGGTVNGANCTNYVAWRLMNNGVAENSLRGLGNASTWAARAPSKGFVVNQTPAVGAVAQWNNNHVAYVEQVNGDGSIVVSESNVYSSNPANRMWLRHRTVPGGSVNNFIHFGGTPTSSGSHSRIITPGDFNGDSHPDIMNVRTNGDLALYTSDGTGAWLNGMGTVVGSAWANSNAFSPGDFNSDGHSDLIAVHPNGDTYLFLGNGASGWINGNGTLIGTGFTFPVIMSPGDFNGDGHSDVIGITSAGDIYLYAGNGSGGWLSGTGVHIGSGFAALRVVVTPGDFNGDSFADLIGVDSSGNLKLYTGNGAGGWLNGTGPVIGYGFASATRIVSPGDWNGDGFSDVLATFPNGNLVLYTGNGAGGWLNGTGTVVGSGW